jgi:hypothetical protein
MKAIKCELCGSNEVIKQDGLYVCQHCGTKYTVDEAKKLMIEGTVNVEGTVKIDDSTELKNLYEIARRARNAENYEDAGKYYDSILAKNPKDWEAVLYVVFCKAMTCKIAEIQNYAMLMINNNVSVLSLIKDNVKDEVEQKLAVLETAMAYSRVGILFSSAAEKHYYEIDSSIRDSYCLTYIKNNSKVAAMLYTIGDGFILYFGDKYGFEAANMWKQAISTNVKNIPLIVDKKGLKQFILDYAEKIKKYDSDYIPPEMNTDNADSESSGCYIATAVYGSYNCPQVWTLRRFRDNTLDATWYGRVFIKTYYAISPTLVRWFGETSWFKEFWRKPLDKLVASLRNKGVEDTPYIDKY